MTHNIVPAELGTTQNKSQKRSIDPCDDSNNDRQLSLARFREWSLPRVDSPSGQSPIVTRESDTDEDERGDSDTEVLTVDNCTIIRGFLQKQIRVATWEVYEAQRRIQTLTTFKSYLVEQLEVLEQAIEERNAHVTEGPKFGGK
ncbi:hypothetical protein CC1G_12525 [Coprinopsis cinerea okayama7|uniref:Uncharacterized protein n=1 Tax=Coprinopsis cinerea (strain Okayama-7 / 130 / ATCC MYA-4618 / FGSC 9003) TaxID=240176 RepID=A8NMW3_COPC7|nr:hypothetical protein CC1G_12525 [Coprinopsis cinerea okayama7\|eukprot:XP_001835000.1 hypothetical protein CC1G_12525 [Coprinopsis cinerea okayama7\